VVLLVVGALPAIAAALVMPGEMAVRRAT
jgi:hypothetical protein